MKLATGRLILSKVTKNLFKMFVENTLAYCTGWQKKFYERYFFKSCKKFQKR